MNDPFHRTRLLVGDGGIERLEAASVAVIGLGGVGGYAAEAVARAGVGRIMLVDADVVDITNMNRQIYALDETTGMLKVDVASKRIASINPRSVLDARAIFVDEPQIKALGLDASWHVIDAIDTFPAKTLLLRHLHDNCIPCASSMGAARRRAPGRVHIADISQTYGCPMARALRRALRAYGIVSGIPCVFSDEPPAACAPACSDTGDSNQQTGKAPVGSISFLPAIFGLTAAGIVINAILDS